MEKQRKIILKKRILSLMLIALVIPNVLLSYGFSVSAVEIKNEYSKIVKSYYSSKNITSALKTALDYTRKNASEKNLLTISLLNGTYEVKETLHLTSYTVIDLNNSKLINTNRERGNIFKSPEDKEYPQYSSLTQCVIKNGTLDGNYNQNKSCILRLCHSENVIVENISFLNNYFSHHAELAACRNVVFRGCTFRGQVSNLNVSSSEAIQIDILDRIHFYGFTSYDNTMNERITVENCYFKNVYRGVGTHNYFKGLYHNGVNINACVFENITDCAVSAVNFKNVSIKNNKYINCKYSVFWRDNGK